MEFERTYVDLGRTRVNLVFYSVEFSHTQCRTYRRHLQTLDKINPSKGVFILYPTLEEWCVSNFPFERTRLSVQLVAKGRLGFDGKRDNLRQ